MAEIPIGAGPAGGLPTAPSPGGGQLAPQPQQGAEQAVPVGPDAEGALNDALQTIMTFALAQREQGNPAIAEAMKGVVMAMSGGAPTEQLPPDALQEAPVGPSGPIPGGQMGMNAPIPV